ncbi:MAG: amino acid adenylation domain-containing protein, partial [Prevotella sp.]|nr:amino acid adenylation domain-containing protein [Prevotella sp.]
YIHDGLVRPFDLLSGEPLFRIEFIETEKGWWQMTDGHHVVFDGMSFTPVIMQIDINKAYMGEELTPHPYGMYQAAEDEVATFGTEVYEKAKAYYAEKFAGLDFATLSRSESGSMGKMARRSTFINRQLCDDWCKEHGVPINLLFQAAFSHILSVLLRQEKVAYFTVNHGRMDKRLRECIGMFVKSVPILANCTTDTTVTEFIKSFRTELMSTIRYGVYPFNHFCRDLKMTSGVSFNFQALADMEEAMILGEERIYGVQPVRDMIDDDMTVFIFFNGENYEMRVESSSAMNDEATLQMMADAMLATMNNMMAAPDGKLKDIAIVSPDEEQQLLSLSKGETLDYDTTETWISLFRRQVENRPDAVAVADAKGTYTYKALDEASDAVALYLIAKGLKADDFVAIRMDRSREFMAAALGCHKASVGYVPIDLDYPAERVDYMLQDSGAKLTIDEQTVSEALAGSFSGTLRPATPENLAYMIYTSGSTGQPKGVMIQHKALLNFVHFIRKEWRLTEQSRIACHSNFAFDAAVEDLYPVLTTGGTLYIVPEEARLDISLLRQYLKDNAITGGCYTTQLGQLLGSDAPLDVDYICLGGEKMTAVPQTTGRVLNTYGPTEFTVDSTFFEVAPDKSYDNIPIGRPLYNLYALVLDGNGHLVPEGAVGELCMAGPQMAKGYWNRPDLTAEKFCDVTIGGRTMKVYHTGDLVRYNDSGNLEFLGRIDFQVKLRGFRIELGEIESRANQFDGIQQVAAEVKNGQTLCLYYTASTDIDKEALKAFLAETLADYMVPSALMQLDEMPLTPNGKVNRKALPEPAITSSAEYVEPEGEVERKVADTMQQILRLSQPVGALDSFMELGGDSIKAIRLVSTLRQLDVNIAVADVMKLKTVRAIAAAHTETTISISQEPWSGEVGDTPIVNYFKDLNLPKPAHYLQSMMLHCSERVDKAALQTAFNAITTQHDMLRAVFNGEHLIVRDADTTITIEEQDMTTANDFRAAIKE